LGAIEIMCLFILGIYSAMTIPSFIAAWALLKRKKWRGRRQSSRAWSQPRTLSDRHWQFASTRSGFSSATLAKVFFDQNYNPYALPAAQPTWANQSWEHDTSTATRGSVSAAAIAA
jgi:hypothetical protein